jgi:DNA repair exonuclease SbcCD ATPase subunit
LNYFNYFSEIESAFVRRRGRNLLLSPLDWALIETWQEREVPLHIILRGIAKVFDAADKQPARKRTIKSLTYCREEIEAQYAEWLESQIGKVQDSRFKTQDSNVIEENSKESELFADDAIIAHLEKVSDELKSAQNKAKNELNQTLKKVLTRLAQLRENVSDVETLEKELEKLDALIDESLLQNYSAEKLKSEIEKEIASYKNKMEAEVYRRTYNLMLLKRLREQAEIPRLSLFYL